MNSTTKAAIFSVALLAVLGIVVAILLDDDGPQIPDPGPEVVDDGGDEGDGTTDVEVVPDGQDDLVKPPVAGNVAVTVSVTDAADGRKLTRSRLRVFKKLSESERVGPLLYQLPEKGAPRTAEFSFKLSPGKYELQARCKGYAAATQVITIYEGKDSFSADLKLAKGTYIAGRILTKAGKPIPGAKVWAFRELGAPDDDLETTLMAIVDLEKMTQEMKDTPPVLSGPDGSYQIDGLTPQLWYTVRASASKFSPGQRKQVNAPSEGVDIRLSEGASIIGVVRGPDGPIEGATIEAYEELENAGLFDVILEKARPAVATGTTDSAGHYELDQLGSGLYNFVVGAPGHQEHQEKKVRARAGTQTKRDFELKVGKIVRGIVRGPDDEPLAGARVAVSQVGGASTGRDQVRISLGGNEKETDEQGYFEFDNLRDGTFMVTARHDFYQSVQKREVRPSESEIYLTLPRGGQIEGVVLDQATGKPIAGATVTVSDIASHRKEATTDQDGKYFISGTNSTRSKVNVTVRAPSYARIRESLKVVGGRKLTKDFELTGTGIVSGYVVIGTNGVPGARVEVRRIQEQTNTPQIVGHGETDSNGKYNITDVEPGAGLSIRVKRRDYLEAYSDTFDVLSAETTEIPSIELKLGGVVEGRVVDTEGRAVNGCMVSALRPGETEMINQNRTAQTNPDGTFRMAGLESGNVDLKFKATNYVEAILEGVEVLEGKKNVGQDIKLEKAGIVGGRIVDSEGNPIAGAEILVRDFGAGGGLQQHRTMSKATGEFSLATIVSKDTVDLEVSHNEFATTELEAVKVGDETIEVSMNSLGRLIGEVVDPNGEPVISFAVHPQPTGNSASARRARAYLKPKNFSDGNFEYRGVPAGKYNIQVRSPLYSAATVAEVEVGEGEVIELPVIRLQEGGRVTGVVVAGANGAPVAGAKVKVVQGLSRFKERTSPTSKPIQTTGADGSFVFTGLKDGTLTLEVSHPDYGSTRVPGVNTQVAAKSIDLEVTLEQGGVINGVVVDDTGAPAANVWVYLRGAGGSKDRRVRSDNRGNFRFDNAPPGANTVKAHKFVPGKPPLLDEQQVTVEAGRESDIELTIVSR
ncbi:MAG: carboxypeptidase-like regulatory domain-containing protein [Planctomycetota bacterium]